MATLKERVDKHDREIAAIKKLLMQGMRLLVDGERRSREEHAKIRQDIRRLEASQERTDKALQVLIGSLKRGGNGHAKGVDVQ